MRNRRGPRLPRTQETHTAGSWTQAEVFSWKKDRRLSSQINQCTLCISQFKKNLIQRSDCDSKSCCHSTNKLEFQAMFIDSSLA